MWPPPCSFEKKDAELPPCELCGGKMTFAGVTLGALRELRTLRCTKCGVVQTLQSKPPHGGVCATID